MLNKKELRKLSDEAIISHFKQKNRNIYIEELYFRYSHLVIGTCMKYLKNLENSEDLTIQIFSELNEDLKKHNVIHFKSWLYTKTKNACFMQLRRKKNDFVAFTDFEIGIDEEEIISSKEILEMRLNLLELALNQLNTDQAYCIREFYLKKRSYDEIQSNSRFSLNQIKSHIQNGKRNLKIIISKKLSAHESETN